MGSRSITSPLDVAIVGGGPCGLALAKGLLAAGPHLKVKVFERVSRLRPVGSGLALYPYGLKALERVDKEAANKVKAAGLAPKTVVGIGNPGEVEWERCVDAGVWGPSMGKALHVRWSHLQQILHDSLPEGTACLNHQFDRLERTPDQLVKLHFVASHHPITAKVLVGCDGYFSRVRRQWLGEGTDPVYTGTVIWRGQVSPQKFPFWETRTTMDERCGKVMTVYGGAPDALVWTISCGDSHLADAGLPVPHKHTGTPTNGSKFSLQAAGGIRSAVDGFDAKHRCLTIAQDHPDLLRSLIEATPAETILEHGIFYRPSDTYPDKCLGEGPITLAGDAFHVMRPTGQGTNMTLEDAAVLAACLARKGACEEALREYEAQRLPRVRKVARASELAGQAMYVADANQRCAMIAESQDLLSEINALDIADPPLVSTVA